MSKPSINVCSPGSEVGLDTPDGRPNVKAVVTAVCVRDSGVTYEVAWWDGRTRRSEWVTDAEVSDYYCGDIARVGFRPTEADEAERLRLEVRRLQSHIHTLEMRLYECGHLDASPADGNAAGPDD